jgi:thioredoxin reductase (NADPH)
MTNNDNIDHRPVIIIGSGAAGLTAAIYTARADLNPLIIAGNQPGGQMTITTEVENYPGFADVIQGPWLMEQMREQAENVGTDVINAMITDINLQSRPFTMTDDRGQKYAADSVIISTGATARWLGLDSEQEFRGYGVSACATCDGAFYKGEEVAVVGGGNSAVEEALFLTKFADKVTVIHRRDELRAEKILQERLFKNDKIDMLWSHEVVEVLGRSPNEQGTDGPPGVTGVRIINNKTDETHVLNVTGLFIAIGHDPATELFKGQIDMDEDGYIITEPDSTITNIDGVFAAGDVMDKKYRQAVTAAGTGCMAALEAEKYLAEQETGEEQQIKAATW